MRDSYSSLLNYANTIQLEIFCSSSNNIENYLILFIFKIASVEKQEEATTKEVDRIYKILKKKTKDGRAPICFFNFVINPDFFGQTVENIFHVAFLIKVIWNEAFDLEFRMSELKYF